MDSPAVDDVVVSGGGFDNVVISELNDMMGR